MVLPPLSDATGKMYTTISNRLTPYLFLAPAVIVMAIALLYPLGYMVYGSFRDWDPSQNLADSSFVGLRNYITLWFDPGFRESLSVTLTFAASVVTAEMLLGVGLALLLDRQLRGMSFLRTLFILPMMIAPVVVGLIWRYMYHPSLGTFNRFLKNLGFEGVDWLGQHALLSVIIADIWQWTPFIFILALAALMSLPRSALDAARIDGASGWQLVWYIKLPLLMPVLIVTGLLRLIDAFKVLEVILVMTEGGPGLRTEILALRISRTATEFRELGVAAAMSNYLLMLLLVLTFATLLASRIVEVRARRMPLASQQEPTLGGRR